MDTEKPRLLLVDDDCAVLRSYVRALREYAPLRAGDGLEAQKILSETRVDIVLCDLEMPRMNGLDLMRWAKEHCPRPLWIVVTGGGTAADAATQALKLGAFDFICKPIRSPIQLQTVVANAARHQALATERALLVRSLADNSLRLAQTNRKLEASNAVLSEQQGVLNQDLQRAERILQALLPRTLPRIQRMQVNVAYLPSKSIGGDFYGAAMLDDRHLAVYVADVAGHGVSAALLAVLFNQRLGVFNAEGGMRTPADLLCELNRALLEECRASGLFVTAVYALIDTEKRTATIASAGHPPGILLRSNGISQRLEKTGPALGLAPDASYEEHRISLAEGDRLLLYTDGLTGALSEHAPGLETIFSAIAAGAGDGAAVIEQLLTWTTHGEQADDDMTLLLLTASAGASTFESNQAAAPRIPPSDCALSIGSAEGSTWVLVRGRATWKDAATLRDTCIEALDGGQSVVVDLASCTMLDSTILGTLHELVVRAGPPGTSLRLQSVGPDIRGLFTELAMTQVLSSIAPRAQPVPAKMSELHAKGVVAAQDYVLHVCARASGRAQREQRRAVPAGGRCVAGRGSPLTSRLHDGAAVGTDRRLRAGTEGLHRADDPVSSCLLCGVHAPAVGQRQQHACAVRPRLPERGASGADGDRDLEAFQPQGASLHEPTQPLGHHVRGGDVGVPQHDGELLAAEPDEHVLDPHAAPHRGGDRREDLVARAVPVPIVDLLEQVEVEHDDRQLRPVAAGMCQSPRAAARRGGERLYTFVRPSRMVSSCKRSASRRRPPSIDVRSRCCR